MTPTSSLRLGLQATPRAHSRLARTLAPKLAISSVVSDWRGIGLDVFATEPYPADGPLLAHPRIVPTAHTASLTINYFAAASRRLGDALASYLSHQPPAGLLGTG